MFICIPNYNKNSIESDNKKCLFSKLKFFLFLVYIFSI